jgi:hypothetical protein
VHGKVLRGDHFQRLRGEAAGGFQRQIRIAHGAGADGALDPLARQFLLQQVDGVDLYQHIGKVLDLIALAARIAINALMLAAAIQIHGVFDAKP